MIIRYRKISDVTDKLFFSGFVQVLTFSWIQNTDHGWPILSMFRFFRISMLRFFKKGNSLVAMALETSFSLEPFFFFKSRKKLLLGIRSPVLFKQGLWNSTTRYKWVSTGGLVVILQINSVSESIMFSGSLSALL